MLWLADMEAAWSVRTAGCNHIFFSAFFNTASSVALGSTLQMKGRWETNINVWFPFMYSQKWNCAASLFPKQNYNVLSPHSFTHMYCIHIFERFIYFQDRSIYFAAAKYVDWSWEYTNRSQTHECRNWDWGRAIPFFGIHKLDFQFSALCRKSEGTAIELRHLLSDAQTTKLNLIHFG